MKKKLAIYLLCLFVINMALVGCSSDDDASSANTTFLYPAGDGNGKYGFINENGEMVIKAIYEHVEKFSCGRAYVVLGGEGYYIDAKGNIINKTPLDYNYVSVEEHVYKNNYAVVSKDGLYGLMDINGNFAVQPIYYRLGEVSDNGLIAFQRTKDSKKGYINTNGDVVLQENYDATGTFYKGVACVGIGQSAGYGAINTKGEWIIQPTYAGLYGIDGKERLQFETTTGEIKYGMMDYNGDIKLPSIYNWVNSVDDCDLICVNEKAKCGFVDVSGNQVIPCTYDYAYCIGNNYYAAALREYPNDYNIYRILDKKGNIVMTLAKDEYCSASYKSGKGDVFFINKKNGGEYRTSQNQIIYSW